MRHAHLVQIGWWKEKYADVVFASKSYCYHCTSPLEHYWQDAREVVALLDTGKKQILHVPSVCGHCGAKHWHHTVLTSRNMGNLNAPLWCAVPSTRGFKRYFFIGRVEAVSYLFITHTFAVSISILLEYERCLFHGAIWFLVAFTKLKQR